MTTEAVTGAVEDGNRSIGTAAAGGRSPNGSLLGRAISQVAQVVPDLDAAMKMWWEGLGIGPWHVYELAAPPMRVAFYRGREVPFRIRVGLAFSGGVMLELIEPLEGDSIWHETLRRGGAASFQHLGIYVDEYDEAVDEMIRHGWRPVQTGEGFGRSGDGVLTYFEHDLGPGILVEVVRAPRERFGPERIYPQG